MVNLFKKKAFKIAHPPAQVDTMLSKYLLDLYLSSVEPPKHNNIKAIIRPCNLYEKNEEMKNDSSNDS